MTDLVERSAAALAADIASGALSAEELMRASLDRIAQTNGVVNAIVGLRDEEALMHDARASDASTATGPLKGLPVAIKDLVNAEGLPTTLGCTIFKNNIAAKDDVMVARMKAAGAIVIGKTNTPEFGLGSRCRSTCRAMCSCISWRWPVPWGARPRTWRYCWMCKRA